MVSDQDKLTYEKVQVLYEHALNYVSTNRGGEHFDAFNTVLQLIQRSKQLEGCMNEVARISSKHIT